MLEVRKSQKWQSPIFQGKSCFVQIDRKTVQNDLKMDFFNIISKG